MTDEILPVSLTMPVSDKELEFSAFPPFFEGLLPEGYQLEGLLKYSKIDRNDLFAQLAGLSRDTKYNYTMEKLVKLIDRFCSFLSPVMKEKYRFLLLDRIKVMGW